MFNHTTAKALQRQRYPHHESRTGHRRRPLRLAMRAVRALRGTVRLRRATGGRPL